MMNRRAFVTGLGALFAAPLASDAQQPNKLWRIGVLAQPPGLASFLDTFREGLRELGYTENRNIVIDTREGEFKELPGLANNNTEVAAKRPQLLREANPKISRVAVIACCTSGLVTDRVIRSLRDQIEHAGQSIGVRIESVMPRSTDVDAAISRVTRSRADALLVTPNRSMVARRVHIAEHAIRETLPTIFDAEQH